MTGGDPSGRDPSGAVPRPINAATSGQDQLLSAVDVSQLVAVTLRLAMEVGALRERLRTHEALLVQQGVLPEAAVESFAPSTGEVQQRLAEHRDLIEALARDLQRR